MFLGKKERDLVKQVNDELAERVVGQTIAYYPISIEDSNFNETYGEAIEKVSLPPIRVHAYVIVENEQTNDRYGYEYQSKLTINFHRKRLTEDQNLYVRVGDFIQYGDIFYEIVKTYNDTRYYFGQVEHKFQISAECVRAREGVFRVMPAVDRPTEVTRDVSPAESPAPRAAPYPPAGASYVTVNAERKLPNERVLTAGSNIVFTDGGAGGSLTVATTSELTASDMRVTGDLTVVGSLVGGSPIRIAGGVEILNPAGEVIAALGSSSAGADVLSASLAVVTQLTASDLVSASMFYGDGSQLDGVVNSPAGSTTEIQFNSAGSFAGSSNLTFNGTTLTGSYTGSLAQFTVLSASGVNVGGVVSGSGLFSAAGGINVAETFTVSAAGAVVASNTISGSGALSVGAGATLAGALNMQQGGITNAGAIAGASTISGSGNLSGLGLALNGGTWNAGGTISADTQVGAPTLTDNTLSISSGAITGGTSYSGSTTISGLSLALNGGNWSAAGVIAADSNITAGGTISGSSTLSGLGITGTSLNVQSGGITNAGAIGGATTVSASVGLSGSALYASDAYLDAVVLQALSGTLAGTGSYLGLDASNNLVLTSSAAGPAGSGDPGGSTTEVQFNSAGAFAGSSNLTFNGTTLTGSYTGSLGQFSVLSASLISLGATSGSLAGAGSYLGLDTSNNLVLTSAASTAGDPAGSDTEVQFNDGGSFGGSSNLTFDGTSLGIGTDSPTYTLDVAGDAGFNEYLYHNGDTNTFIRFVPDRMYIEAGGENMLYLVSGSGGDQNAKVTVNNDGVDVDFQVKGDNEANLIRTDAANDMVGIGTANPSHTLTVAGDSYLSGAMVHKRTAIATHYTASATDYIIGITSVPLSIEFNATVFNDGQVVVVKDESGNASATSVIAISGASTQTIDGDDDVAISSPYGSILLYCNGTNWFIY